MIKPAYEFHHAAVAGTFDRLHDGHKALLCKALEIAEHVSIGITDQKMTAQKKFAPLIEPLQTRKQAVLDFISTQDALNRVSFFVLHDIYGPALSDPSIAALVVSTETVPGAKTVNAMREAQGLPPLAIVVADYLPSNDNSYLSSTRIREGEINRNGFSYLQFLEQYLPFRLTSPLRMQLQQPIGTLLEGNEANMAEAVKKAKRFCANAAFVYTVGDIVTETFRQNEVFIDLAVFDYRNKRLQTKNANLHTKDKHNWFIATNEAGTISRSAVTTLMTIQDQLNQANNKRAEHNLLIGGEEDLLVLPLVLLSPLQSVIFYGQSGQGIVGVVVTEAEKEKIVGLLSLAHGE